MSKFLGVFLGLFFTFSSPVSATQQQQGDPEMQNVRIAFLTHVNNAFQNAANIAERNILLLQVESQEFQIETVAQTYTVRHRMLNAFAGMQEETHAPLAPITVSAIVPNDNGFALQAEWLLSNNPFPGMSTVMGYTFDIIRN